MATKPFTGTAPSPFLGSTPQGGMQGGLNGLLGNRPNLPRTVMQPGGGFGGQVNYNPPAPAGGTTTIPGSTTTTPSPTVPPAAPVQPASAPSLPYGTTRMPFGQGHPLFDPAPVRGGLYRMLGGYQGGAY